VSRVVAIGNGRFAVERAHIELLRPRQSLAAIIALYAAHLPLTLPAIVADCPCPMTALFGRR
jgi:hypothetical protein